MLEAAEQIHESSLALLDNPGIRFEHDGVCELLIKAGARPGAAPNVVRIPPELVAECLGLCPAQVHLADKAGAGKWIGAEGETSIWSVPGLYIYQDGQRRPFNSEDMAGISRLMEHLGEVDGVFGFAMADVVPGARDVVGLRIMAEHSSKHLRVLCFTPEGADLLVNMKPVVGDYPWFSVGFTAHGPLRWTKLALDIFARTAGHGIPVSINGEPMAGVSGPVTLAGSAAVGNAEILAGIAVNQLLESGRPCIYNLGLAHTFDMRTAIAVTGGPENALFAKISAAMGRFYQIPCASWVSTDSMRVDAQAALEKMFGFQTHLASGVSSIWGVGQLESEMTISPAQAVIDNEMIAYAKRYQRGLATTEEALAVELTREVGIAGSFLETSHTAAHFRDELFMPEILNRKTHDTWKAAGGKDLAQVAEEKASELMKTPVDNGLTENQIKELDALANRFLDSCT